MRRVLGRQGWQQCRARGSHSSPPKVEAKKQCALPPEVRADVQRLCTVLKRIPPGPDAAANLGEAVDRLTGSHVVEVLKRLYDANVALFFFRWAGLQAGYKHGCGAYNRMLAVLGRAKKFKEVTMLLEEMRRRRCKISSCTYGILLSCYGKAGMVDEAIDAFSAVMYACREARTKTFNTLLFLLTKSKRIEMAESLYRRMLYAGCLPDTFTVNIMVRGLCNGNKIDEAFQLLQQLEAKGIAADIVTYNSLIGSLCKTQKQTVAVKLFVAMQEKGRIPDSTAYKVLIRGLCEGERVDEAIQMIEKSFVHGYVPSESSIRTVITAACRSNRSKDAYTFFHRALLQRQTD